MMQCNDSNDVCALNGAGHCPHWDEGQGCHYCGNPPRQTDGREPGSDDYQRFWAGSSERARLRAEVDRLRGLCKEADRLLRVAYADADPEDVPMDVLQWLNPDPDTAALPGKDA